jgi:hypothetical protein
MSHWDEPCCWAEDAEHNRYMTGSEARNDFILLITSMGAIGLLVLCVCWCVCIWPELKLCWKNRKERPTPGPVALTTVNVEAPRDVECVTVPPTSFDLAVHATPSTLAT